MSRTVLMALGLIGLAACGGGHAKAKPKGAVARSTSATTHQQASNAARKKRAGSRADTTTQKNPLTNR